MLCRGVSFTRLMGRINIYIHNNGPNRDVRGQREGARLGRAQPARAQLEHHHPGEAVQGALRPAMVVQGEED